MNSSWSHIAGSARVIPKNVFAELPQTYELSKEQMQFYSDNGYLVIKELIDFASLYNYKKRFIQVCNRLVDKGSMSIVKEPSLVDKQRKPEDYVNKINDVLYDDVFGTYVVHPRLLHVLSQFIGDNITAVNSMIINKPPGTDRHPPHQHPRLLHVLSQFIGDNITAVNSMIINKLPGTDRHPPHQDLYYFPFRPADKIIAAWTAIDHVDLENGCLYVIPGSHKNATLYEHGSVGSTKKLYHGIVNEEGLAPLAQRAQLEMSPGDTVFFHPLLVHGSGANVSKNYRKSMTCHFASSDCYYIDVAGTVQDAVAKEITQEAKRRGFELSFAETWKYRSRQVKGVRSNL